MKHDIYIAASPGQPWQISVEQVEAWFRERWPDAVIVHENDVLTGHPRVVCQMTAEGESRRVSFRDKSQLTLRDGSPDFWAEFIAWFLNRLPCRSIRPPTGSRTSSPA